MQSGSSSLVKIEIDDPEVQAIEFVILDEAQNKWYYEMGIVNFSCLKFFYVYIKAFLVIQVQK